MYECFACICLWATMYSAHRDQRGLWILWNGNFRWSWAATLVLESNLCLVQEQQALSNLWALVDGSTFKFGQNYWKGVFTVVGSEQQAAFAFYCLFCILRIPEHAECWRKRPAMEQPGQWDPASTSSSTGDNTEHQRWQPRGGELRSGSPGYARWQLSLEVRGRATGPTAETSI